MRIFIRIKAAGKRRDMLEKRARVVPGDIGAPETLIEYLVRENVRAYNAEETDAPFFRCLSRQALEDGALRAGSLSAAGKTKKNRTKKNRTKKKRCKTPCNVLPTASIAYSRAKPRSSPEVLSG
jgi:hypothetical protein